MRWMSQLIGGWTDAVRRDDPSRPVEVARWVALNVGLGAMWSGAAFLLVRPFTNTWGLRGAGVEPMLAGNYFASTLITEVVYVPLYLVILSRMSRRHPESFRRWAVVWSLGLFILPIPWVLAITTPEGQAYLLFRLLFGLTAQPLPAAGAAATERHPRALARVTVRGIRLIVYAAGLLIALFLALWLLAAIVYVLAGVMLAIAELI